MPVRLLAFCVSEKTNVNAWLMPRPELGDTESTEGWGGGMVTVQVPREIHPVLAPASAAYRYVVLPPPKPGWNASDTVKVSVLPEMLVDVPTPFTMHWLFCWLPPPGTTVTEPLDGTSSASEITFVAEL